VRLLKGGTVRLVAWNRYTPAVRKRGATAWRSFGIAVIGLGLAACGGGGGSPEIAPAGTDTVAATASAPAAPAGATKWYPGHYLTMSEPADDDEVRRRLDLLGRFRGVQRFYHWRELEPSRDAYDFSRVATDLEQARRLGLPMAIQIEVQPYHAGRDYVPAYVTGAEFGGGTYLSSVGVRSPVLWHPAVADRVVRLYRALGATFDGHPNLAVVTTPETSPQWLQPGTPAAAVVPYSEAGLLDSFRVMAWALGTGFPTTVTLQYLNYPIAIIDPLVRELVAQRVGLGGPDVYVADPGLSSGVYPFYLAFAGVLPLGTAVQWDNYATRRFHGPADEPAIAELFEFGRSRLQDSFMFWEIREAPGTDYFARLVQAARLFPAGNAGGLRETCPSVFAACTNATAPLR